MLHCNLLFCIIFIVCGTVLYCEIFADYLTFQFCSWPKLGENQETLHALILADTHLLGPIRGHWLDKIYREYHMYRAFQTAVSYFKPEVIFILGDLFDEGDIVNQIEFEKYVERFHRIFNVPNNIQLLSAVGNHDIGFHYKMHSFLTNRFKTSFNNTSANLYTIKGINFVFINSMAMKNDGCYFCEKTIKDLLKISDQLKNSQNISCLNEYLINKKNCFNQPVVLQHFPTFRTSDISCNESDAPTLEHFRENWEVLSEKSTKLLGRLLKPRCVFSGHSHNYCSTINILGIEEYTVASFNWRNKVNPSFLLGVFSASEHSVSKCNMLNQELVYNTYVYAGTIICALIFIQLLYAIIKKSFFRPRKKQCKLN